MLKISEAQIRIKQLIQQLHLLLMANIVRTNSETFPAGDNSQAHSSISLSQPGTRHRVPAALMTALRGVVLGHMVGQGEASMKKSKFGQFVSAGIKSTVHKIKDILTCEICEGDIIKPKEKSKQFFMCDCEHKFNFCESCLHHYVIYKVKNFQEVNCPREGCPAILDMNTNFFQCLPADIQKHYKKISQFNLISKDPDAKLCPWENCDGVIRKRQGESMVCNTCKRQFCSKCLLEVHQGNCDRQEVIFFQKNLKYRQCKRCKIIVEKKQGCNHIRCRCKYQFCYVCGAQWTVEHYGNHDQNGNLLGVPNPGPRRVYRQVQNIQNEYRCCHCAAETCGNTCACLIKLPIQIILMLLYGSLMLMYFMCSYMIAIVMLLFITLVAGVTGFALETLAQMGVWCFIGVLLFPVVMVYGIGRAFVEIFIEPVGNLCQDFIQKLCSGLNGIIDM